RRRDHASEKDGEKGEETVVAGFAVHVLGGEGRDDAAKNEREHRQGNGQAIELELDGEVETAAGFTGEFDPVAEIEDGVPRAGGDHDAEDAAAGQEAGADGQPGGARRGLFGETRIEKRRNPE